MVFADWLLLLFPVAAFFVTRAFAKSISVPGARALFESITALFPIAYFVLQAPFMAGIATAVLFILASFVLVSKNIFVMDWDSVQFPFAVLVLLLVSNILADPVYMIVPPVLAVSAMIGFLFVPSQIPHSWKIDIAEDVLSFLISLGISFWSFNFLGCPSLFWPVTAAATAVWAYRAGDRKRMFSSALFVAAVIAAQQADWSMIMMGLGVSLMLSSLAFYMKALTKHGLIAAVLLGTVAYAAHPMFYFLLLAFFLTSVLLTRFRHKDKDLSDYQKDDQRNHIQVLANGFPIALAAALQLGGFNAVPAAVAAIAAAAADTWATEIGTLSKQKPRLIMSLKHVDKGRSGGVTILGFFGSLLASLVIFALSFPFFGWTVFPAAVVGGLIGSLADSLLGATVQSLHVCRVCGKLTEKDIHCGKSSRQTTGIGWMDNDMVNIVSILTAMFFVYL